MPRPPCDTTMLEALRRQALIQAAGTADPLLKAHYVELADSYAATAVELREKGAAILPPIVAIDTPWRSIGLSAPNDP